MATYEVFLKGAGKEPFEHVGALEADDDELALLLVRETYARRGEGVGAWVVRRNYIQVADPQELALTAFRTHASNDGSAVAARRRAHRDSE